MAESDAEFLARIEAEDASAFAAAVAEWRTERVAGGGAARIVEAGGGFVAVSEAASDDGLDGVDAEWLAGEDEYKEQWRKCARSSDLATRYQNNAEASGAVGLHSAQPWGGGHGREATPAFELWRAEQTRRLAGSTGRDGARQSSNHSS